MNSDINLDLKFAVVLPAGGVGARFGANKPKQLLELNGRPIWTYSVDLFVCHPQISQVIFVCPVEFKEHFESEMNVYFGALSDKIKVVVGGKERWLSVQNGVNAISPHIEGVLVHDVARPGLSVSIIDECIKMLRNDQGCLVAKPVADTVKVVQNGVVQQTLDRSTIWLAQTPQCFSKNQLLKVYQKMQSEIGFNPTDEAGMMEHFGVSVHIVEGNTMNDKITQPEDLVRLELVLSTR